MCSKISEFYTDVTFPQLLYNFINIVCNFQYVVNKKAKVIFNIAQVQRP